MSTVPQGQGHDDDNTGSTTPITLTSFPYLHNHTHHHSADPLTNPFEFNNPFADMPSSNPHLPSSLNTTLLPPLPESPKPPAQSDPLMATHSISTNTHHQSPLIHRSGLLSPSLRRSSNSTVLVTADDPLSIAIAPSPSISIIESPTLELGSLSLLHNGLVTHRRGPLAISQTQLLLPSVARSPFHIKVLDPAKVGDGIKQFVNYKVITKTDAPDFNPESFVSRRYSEFLWFAKRISVNHPGVVLPGFPEKQTLGRFQEDFVEHRRVALQIFLRKCGAHPILSKDPLFRKFLELDSLKDELLHDKPPPLLVKGSKLTELDPWFQDRRVRLDQFEHQVKSMQKSLYHVANCLREVATAHHGFGETILMLAEIEVPQISGRSLEKLGELHKRMRDIMYAMAQLDLGHLELALDDQLRTLASIKSSMQVRTNAYQNWQTLETTHVKKQAAFQKSRYEQPQLKSEIDTLNDQVRVSKCNFETISKTLRSELDRIENDKIHEMSISLQAMADTTFAHQQSMVHLWEDFLEINKVH